MRVVHLTSAHPQRDNRILLKECVSLSIEHDVSLIVLNGESEKFQNIDIINAGFSKGRLSRMLGGVHKVLVEALKIKADVYHLHDPELLRVVNQLKKTGAKIIYDAHEDLPRQLLTKHYISPFFRKKISRIVELFEYKIVSKLDGVIAATPFIRERFEKVNSNVVDVCNYPIVEIEENKNGNKKNQICYVGGISRERGIYELMDSLDSIDAKLILAGKFFSKEVESDIINHRNWHKVEFKGFVDTNEVQKIYSETKVGIVTLYPTLNYIDAIPVKLFEYLSNGLPVVLSDIPQWKKLIEGVECGLFVNPYDSTEISKAVNSILKNKEKEEKFSNAGRIATKKKFNWTIEQEKLLNFYSNL